MKTPKVIPPLAPSKMSTLRLGKIMTMEERFEIIGKLFKGYIGDFIRLLEEVETCSTVEAAKGAMVRAGGNHWLENIETMAMLESKIEKLYES